MEKSATDVSVGMVLPTIMLLTQILLDSVSRGVRALPCCLSVHVDWAVLTAGVGQELLAHELFTVLLTVHPFQYKAGINLKIHNLLQYLFAAFPPTLGKASQEKKLQKSDKYMQRELY